MGRMPFEASDMLDTRRGESRFLLHCLAVSAFGAIFTVGLTDAVWYGGADMGAALRQEFLLARRDGGCSRHALRRPAFFPFGLVGAAGRKRQYGRADQRSLILSLALSHLSDSARRPRDLFRCRHHARISFSDRALFGSRLRDERKARAESSWRCRRRWSGGLGQGRHVETIPAREIMPGDRILLASGERAPVNGRSGRSRHFGRSFAGDGRKPAQGACP